MKNMLSLADELTMTLKEITDLLDVRHNDAMAKVASMAKEPSFGVLRKTRITSGGAGGRPTETYVLDKRQSMAVASKLNTALLMRVIDRWLELEASVSPVMTLEQMTLAVIQGQQQKIAEMEAQALLDKPKVKFAEVVTESGNTRCIRVWVKSMKHENNLIVGERAVFKWLLDNRYIFKEGSGYLPYAKYEANGLNYFTVVIDEINGKPRRMLKITGKGVVALTGKVVECFCGNERGLVPA
jgi:phage antirepressor YoqD-like protein